MSYENLILYGATIPSFDSDKKDSSKPKEEVLRVDDPANRQLAIELIKQMV